MTDVFPPRNLPGRAEQWGRIAQTEVENVQGNGGRISASLQNSIRASSGQLSTLSRNIRELSYRSAETFRVNDMTVAGSATSEPFPRTNTLLTFGAVPGTRYAQLSISGTVSSTATIGERMYLYGLLRGEVVCAAWAQPYRPTSTPNEWFNNAPIQAFGLALTLPDVAPEVTIRIVRAADSFSPGSSTLTFKNIVVTLSRAGAR